MSRTLRPVVPRQAALDDVEAAIDALLLEGGADLALRFVEALELAYQQIARQPGIGSPRLGVALNLPELRTWALQRFPYRVCYVEHDSHLDVWRVLHERRDLPAQFQAS